jgi:hypothetical protein
MQQNCLLPAVTVIFRIELNFLKYVVKFYLLLSGKPKNLITQNYQILEQEQTNLGYSKSGNKSN